MNSRIAEGYLRHRRHIGTAHQFKYSIFMMLIDLSELNELFNGYWFWSVNRPNIANFNRKLYLDNLETDLLQCAKETLKNQAGVHSDQVFLLTNLSYCGYCFNPISLYFCFENHELVGVISEVTNMPWKERIIYVCRPKNLGNQIYSTVFQKRMHVSPFLGMDYQYSLKFKYTDSSIHLHIDNIANNKRDFDATLNLSLKTINSRNLSSTLLKYPFMTTKVVAAIHWQAVKLWLKRNTIFKHPSKLHD